MGTWESGVGNSRMAKLFSAKLVRICGKWSLKSKDMETTLRDMEVDVAMEVARELGSTERMNSQVIGSGSWKENQRMKNHANYFEKPWPS